ncbi:MAG: AIPR family protein [Bacteroidales bacterium]|nr:AIPR family protein [Bacteroidales bacterium]
MSNSKILLDTLVSSERTEIAPELSVQDYFEIFSASNVLKDKELSYDELCDGVVDGGDDGGVDSIYLFVGNEYINEEIQDYSIFKRGVTVELIVIQSKYSDGFKEIAVEKLHRTLNDLLQVDFDKTKLQVEYNKNVIEKFELISGTLKNLVIKFPKLKFDCYYVSKGDSSEIHEKVKRKSDRLKEDVQDNWVDSTVNFHFFGANELLKEARRTPNVIHKIKTNDGFSPEKNMYIALVNLAEFYQFIKNENNHLDKNLFEANIRDYQGNVTVNKAIRDTLEESGTENFWWLNNGITILATKMTSSGKELVIESPQIVNGLQTSNEIYRHFANSANGNQDKSVLIRVICPESEDSRDKIIRATNSQTSIPAVSLRGSDKVHRNIETYFKSYGYYYDRRKNQYKNEGKPIDKIISLSFLGQSLMAIILHKPNVARARPSTLLNNNDEYLKLFNEENSLKAIYNCALLLKRVDTELKKKHAITTTERSDLSYYVCLDVAYRKFNSLPTWDLMDSILVSEITSDDIDFSFSFVQSKYNELGATNKVAKGIDLITWQMSQY